MNITLKSVVIHGYNQQASRLILAFRLENGEAAWLALCEGNKILHLEVLKDRFCYRQTEQGKLFQSLC